MLRSGALLSVYEMPFHYCTTESQLCVLLCLYPLYSLLCLKCFFIVLVLRANKKCSTQQTTDKLFSSELSQTIAICAHSLLMQSSHDYAI
jgi:hypothetical protein